ncbi:MAG: hypothetical protein JSW05_02365 [Candidatus Thorarchaeota archaeon]|nr:MAG: hypothetical protein JSW05_02365 [Candidatus Thorarchaeota archaeon]
MKVKLKIEEQWLELERQSMQKMLDEYKAWEQKTLKKAREAEDLRGLRDVFYELGDRWEWSQTAGAWLSAGEPLDTVGLVIRMPGLVPNKERYVVYAVMAYSKGFTDKFDHLGDKERIIIERDVDTGQILCWSTSGHGAIDVFPVDLSTLQSVENALDSCSLVAQPGDHALRLETPAEEAMLPWLARRLWEIAGGDMSFSVRQIDVLDWKDVEESLDFRFYRYANAVVELERVWTQLSGGTFSKAREVVLDQVPSHIETRVEETLRRIEGLLHVLWFKPPAKQVRAVRTLYSGMRAEPTPTEAQRELQPYLGELLYSLTDILEKAKFLKWRSVLEKKEFSESDVFRNLELSALAKEALATVLEDILCDHTLAYIGYPERATIRTKIVRVFFGIAILPVRLLFSFKRWITGAIVKRIPAVIAKGKVLESAQMLD